MRRLSSWWRMLLIVALAVVAGGQPASGSVGQSHSQPVQSASVAENAQNMALVSRLGGRWEGIVVEGGYLYAGHSERFVILNIANLANPVEVGSLGLDHPINDVYLHAGYAYVATDEVMYVLDISNPAAPRTLHTFAGGARIAGAGNFVYYIAGKSLLILNVAAPLNPVLTGPFSYDASWPFRSLAVVDHYVYLGTGSLLIIDVADPAAPVLANSLYLGWAGHDALVVSGNRLYSGSYHGLIILDLTQPTAPAVLGSTQGHNAVDLVVSGNLAYIAGLSQFYIFNVASMANIYLVSTTPSTGQRLRLIGTSVLLADGGDLKRVNVANPSAPQQEVVWHTPAQTSAIAVVGSYAYLAGARGLYIVDIADQAKPIQRSFFPAPDTSNGFAAISIVGRYAYLAANRTGLMIVDIFNPAAPVEVARLLLDQPAFPGNVALDVAIAGSHAYVITANGLVIVNIANPASPQQVSFYELGYYVLAEVRIVGMYAYLAATYYGIIVLNIANPAAPVEVGAYDTDLSSESIAIDGQYAYVADWSGVLILDLRDPTAPVDIGLLDTPTQELTVRVADGYLYVGGRADIHVFDISIPTRPVLIGYQRELQPPDIYEPQGHSVSNNLVYIASVTGLFIVRFIGHTPAGRVVDRSGTPIPGVTMVASTGAITTTDSLGQYRFAGTLAHTFAVTPTLAGARFWPPRAAGPTAQHAPRFVLLPPAVAATVEAGMGVTLSYTDTEGLRTSLILARGVISQPTTLRLAPTLETHGGGWAFSGHSFEFTASPWDASALSTPVTATIEYTAAEVAVVTDSQALELRWWNGAAWQSAPTTCAPGQASTIIEPQRITVGLCATGRYGLFGPTQQLWLDRIGMYR